MADILRSTTAERPTSHYKIAKITFVTIIVLTLAVILVLLWTTRSSTFMTFTVSTVVNLTKNQSIKLFSFALNRTAPKSNGKVMQGSAGIKLYRNSTRVSVVFDNMPDPCAKPRRNTGAEDLLCMKPLEFLPNYKNPCWMDGNELRCLPYFHLFGICKSGTSDLFKRLYLHPDIIPNKGILEKETWFWSWRRYTNRKVGNIMVPTTLRDFSKNFKANEIQNAVDKNGYHFKVTGHGDPMDIWDRFLDVNIPQNDPKAKELLWTSAFLVRKVNPDVKLLLMLRDPVERLYSTYFHWQLGKTSADFHAHVIRAVPLWKNCLEQYSMRHCIYDKPLKDQMKVPIYSSFYMFHLKEWLRAFPREQILVMRNEDYAKDIKGTLKRIFTFLNVSIPNDGLMQHMQSLRHFYETERKVKAGPMLEETKQLLIDLYRQPTEELAELLKDSRFAFKDVSFA